MGKENIKIIPEKIQIFGLRVLSGQINCPPDIALQNPQIEGCLTDINAEFKVNRKAKNILYIINVKLNAVGPERKPLPIEAQFSIEIRFHVENFDDYVITSTDKNIVIKGVLAVSLAGIAYSTARGVIATRTEGTILKGVLIPVVDPKSIISKQMKMEGEHQKA